MPRSRKAWHHFALRIPEEIYQELLLTRAPELLSPQGEIRYGALNGYFLRLLSKDLQEAQAKMISLSTGS